MQCISIRGIEMRSILHEIPNILNIQTSEVEINFTSGIMFIQHHLNYLSIDSKVCTSSGIYQCTSELEA